MEMTLKAGALLKGGEYKIIRVLGQGGFGITYEAEQVALKRTVAVKEFFMKDTCEREATTASVTVPTASNRELVAKFRRKFIREAQMIAAMDHPYIVRVTDVFEENGTAYYVMDNLPGGSLSDLVKKSGRLSEGKALDYIHQVSAALSYIHSCHFVHLDVKPSNILLNRSGSAVLIDFGISKHYDTDGEQTSSTPVGQSKGYAPLEQGRAGDVAQFTPATDIYALGATLFYLVSGQTPPEASIVYEDGLDRIPGVSDTVWNAIVSAMQPRRKDRPQSVEVFLALLPATPTASSGMPSDSFVIPSPSPDIPSVAKESEKEDSERTTYPGTPDTGIPGASAFIPSAAKESEETVFSCDSDDSRFLGNTKPFQQQSSGTSKTGYDNGHEWVDLGLPSGTKWATCNVGASSPSEYGNYYAWGETMAKSEYTREEYRFLTSATSSYKARLSKYNIDSAYGAVDNKKQLDSGDDVACQNWGGKWRIPSKAQWEELSNKCTWSWTGSGYKVTGPNGQSITLPAAGWRNGSSSDDVGSYGNYWSSLLDTANPNYAWYICFGSGGYHMCSDGRCLGFSVRPVTE